MEDIVIRIPAHLRKKFIKEAINNGMKVLTLDTETSHTIARLWSIGYKISVQHTAIKVPTKVITIQYKWANEKKPKWLKWDKVSNKYDDSRNFDDAKMIEEFTINVLSKADIIIGQNSDSFDLKVLNERAKELHLTPLDQKPSIDILKLSRKSVRAASHKLDYRSSQQGLGGKIKMIEDDWVDIEERGVSVTKKMVPYGLKDVLDTEELFWEELPYYKDLPVVVERVILEYLKEDPFKRKSPIICPECRRNKKLGSDVIIKGIHAKCNNCNNKWKIKK